MINGIANKNWDITSGGVINAENRKKDTIKCGLYDFNVSTVAKLALTITNIISGNWKVNPKAKVKIIMKE